MTARTTRMHALALVAAGAIAIAGCGANGDDEQTGTGGEGEIPSYATDVAQQAEELGCTVTAPEQLEADHLENLDDTDYSSDPPTSGTHFQDWALWGFYDEPVHDGYVIHNLEHGGVALWYGDDLPGERRDLVRDDVLDDAEKWVVMPREDVDGIAAAAWGLLMRCDSAALDGMDDETFSGLLDSWYEDVNSQQTDVEKNVPPVPPPGDTDDFDPPLPEPVRDISLES